jgi:hypothetical protein
MKRYVTPEIDMQAISTADIVTLSITGFKGLYTQNDSVFEDNGMNI